VDLNGSPLDLPAALLAPEKRLTYVVAASKGLADEVCKLLGSNADLQRAGDLKA
jgi:hypothetical protein